MSGPSVSYNELDEGTKKILREKFNVDGAGDEEVNKRLVAVGKVLRDIGKLTIKEAMWVLSQVADYLIPPVETGSPDDREKENTIEEVIRVTAKVYNLEYEVILGRRKETIIVEARQMAMYILSSDDKYSLTAIGIIMGRSPATVGHAYSKMCSDIPKSRSKRVLLKEIKLRLGIIE